MDIALACMPFEEEVIARSQAVEVGGISFRIPTPEDLIILKAIAHRPEDIADIANLGRYHPQLDRSRLRDWLLQFGDLLDDPSLWPDTERVLNSVAD